MGIFIHKADVLVNKSVQFLINITNYTSNTGMHEIVGTVLHCLERELQAWTDSNSLQLLPYHFLREAFSIDSIEAHTFWLFSRYGISLSRHDYEDTHAVSLKPFCTDFSTRQVPPVPHFLSS